MAYPNVNEDRFTLLVSNAKRKHNGFFYFLSLGHFHPSILLVGTSSVELFSPGLPHSSYRDINVTQALTDTTTILIKRPQPPSFSEQL